MSLNHMRASIRKKIFAFNIKIAFVIIYINCQKKCAEMKWNIEALVAWNYNAVGEIVG